MREKERRIATGRNKWLDVGHGAFRPDVPKISDVEDKFSKVETSTLEIGSYKGSECLGFSMIVGTYFRESDREIKKYGNVSIPYSEIELMEKLRDVINGAIADAKEWQAEQDAKDA